jgi:hypothetical protein
MWIERWREATGDSVFYAPYQEVACQFPGIPLEEFESAVQLIEPDGRRTGAAEAVFRALASHRRNRWMLRAYERLPGARRMAEGFYAFVAGHRVAFSFLTRLFWGSCLRKPSYILVRNLFLKGLAVIYALAFASLAVQAKGLFGSQGIIPAPDLFAAVRERLGAESYRLLPTLFWLNTSDAALTFLPWAGVGLSCIAFLGFAPALSFFVLWIFYLSLSVVGLDFLSFQWDVLLLEMGFLALFFAPPSVTPTGLRRAPVPSAVLWLLRWLLFRLMFGSGMVKLLSGDSTWKHLTALNYHYETQPLPPWTAWYAHQWPAWFQKLSTVFMFGIELAVPFLIFAPRRLRFLAAGLLIVLQLIIVATGNYCFFNLLAILLCLLLFDDQALACLAKKWAAGPRESLHGVFSSIWRRAVILPAAVFILVMSTVQFTRQLRIDVSWPRWLEGVQKEISPFRSINTYGLFAVMTTSRPEIVVEGSQDGENWLAYEFKYKPGNLKTRPKFVAPHQPRLDWQMWFAALGNYRNQPWFLRFLKRLLEGSPEVLRLLEKNPFPARPPRYIRALLYEYHFAGPDAKKKEGVWWRRELIGLYCPVISLREPGARDVG